MTEDQETIPAEMILVEKIPVEIEDSILSLHRAALVDVKKNLFNNRLVTVQLRTLHLLQSPELNLLHRLLHIVRHNLTNHGTDAKLKPVLKSTAKNEALGGNEHDRRKKDTF